jgi:hypothetical protein
MDIFAEAANSITVHHFPTKKKQTSVFRLQKTYGSVPFPSSFCSKSMEVAIFR